MSLQKIAEYLFPAGNFAQIRAHMMKLNIMIDEYKDYYESDVINNDKETKQDKK